MKLVTAEPKAPGENPIAKSGRNDVINIGVTDDQEEGTAKKTKRKKKTKAKQATIRQRGPLLITHTGMSNIEEENFSGVESTVVQENIEPFEVRCGARQKLQVAPCLISDDRDV